MRSSPSPDTPARKKPVHAECGEPIKGHRRVNGALVCDAITKPKMSKVTKQLAGPIVWDKFCYTVDAARRMWNAAMIAIILIVFAIVVGLMWGFYHAPHLFFWRPAYGYSGFWIYFKGRR
ncbi:hypothetical protein R3P38DRAFT_3167251 [Favolaschia claudopus]|uniref:Uncharacterized protein n=1 Tax=Favolaschia claudopus TaxID=2862362 RepID=A0AAW0EAX5_9AGAR